jgi:hypothetical protein
MNIASLNQLDMQRVSWNSATLAKFSRDELAPIRLRRSRPKKIHFDLRLGET